jgi:hypothetical protein
MSSATAPGNVFDRNGRIDAVLIKKIDRIDAQSFQGRFCDCADVLGPAIQFAAAGSRREIDVEAEFSRDHDLAVKRQQRFADEYFIGEWTVGFGRIEEGHAALNSAWINAIISCLSAGGP